MKTNKNFQTFLKPQEQVDLFFRESLGIVQNPNFFSFSMDAILLADFVRVTRRTHHIVDFCSGNGVIPLLLSHKTSSAILGLEIQKDLVEMAQRSIQMNGLENQIQMIRGDVNEFKRHDVLYDIVTCNPPYFTLGDHHNHHQVEAHAIARHEILLTLEQWVAKAGQVLKIKGRLVFVHRPSRLDEIMDALWRHNFSVHRLRFVHPKKDCPANTVLVEAIYGGNKGGVNVEVPLIVYDDSENYTPELQQIYYGK